MIGVIALVLALGIGAAVTMNAEPPALDGAWFAQLLAHRSSFWTTVAVALDFIGGGWFGVYFVPLGCALALVLLRKPWSAGYFLLTSAVAAGLVQLLKSLYGRARPPDVLVTVDFGSFPSGHVANAAAITVALWFLLGHRWAWWVVGAAYVLAMALSRTYAGAHWLSDTAGGALVGAAVAILMWVPLAGILQKEWSGLRPHGSVGA